MLVKKHVNFAKPPKAFLSSLNYCENFYLYKS